MRSKYRPGSHSGCGPTICCWAAPTTRQPITAPGDSPTHPLTHSPTHPLTHSPTHALIYILGLPLPPGPVWDPDGVLLGGVQGGGRGPGGAARRVPGGQRRLLRLRRPRGPLLDGLLHLPALLQEPGPRAGVPPQVGAGPVALWTARSFPANDADDLPGCGPISDFRPGMSRLLSSLVIIIIVCKFLCMLIRQSSTSLEA